MIDELYRNLLNKKTTELKYIAKTRRNIYLFHHYIEQVLFVRYLMKDQKHFVRYYFQQVSRYKD
jgi:hypothetical protein